MKRTLAIFCALLSAVTVWAQTKIKVEVHNIVELSERFNVVFVIEGEHSPQDFSWSPGDDFSVVWGPQKGTSTSISMVNGKTTRNTQVSYTYILQAKKTGSFTLPSASSTVKGKDISSSPVTVEVVDNGTIGSRQPQAQADIFMRLSLSRNNVVQGEPVTATLKIYHRANLAGFEGVKFPTFKGFWSQEVDAPTILEFQKEEVNGAIYNATLVRRWVISPQMAGDITIDPAEITFLVNVPRSSINSSLFDDFYDNDYVQVRQKVYSDSPTLHVSQLPVWGSIGRGQGDNNQDQQSQKETY